MRACMSGASPIWRALLGKLMPCFKGGLCHMICCVGHHGTMYFSSVTVMRLLSKGPPMEIIIYTYHIGVDLHLLGLTG